MTAGLIKQLHLLPRLGTFAVPAVCDIPQRDPWEHSRNRAGGVNRAAGGAKCQRAAGQGLGNSSLAQLLPTCCAQHCPGHGSHWHSTEISQLACPEPSTGTHLVLCFSCAALGGLSHLGIRSREIKLALKGSFLLQLGMLTAERTPLRTCSSCWKFNSLCYRSKTFQAHWDLIRIL